MQPLFLSLPDDIVGTIIFLALEANIYLKHKIDLFLVCKAWRKILLSNFHLWQQLYTNLGWTLIYTTPIQAWHEICRRLKIKMEKMDSKYLLPSLIPPDFTEDLIYNEHGWDIKSKDDSNQVINILDVSTSNRTLIKYDEDPINDLHVWYNGKWHPFKRGYTKIWRNYLVSTQYLGINSNKLMVVNLDTLENTYERYFDTYFNFAVDAGYLFIQTNDNSSERYFDNQITVVNLEDGSIVTKFIPSALFQDNKRKGNLATGMEVSGDYICIEVEDTTLDKIEAVIYNWKEKKILRIINSHTNAFNSGLMVINNGKDVTMYDIITGDVLAVYNGVIKSPFITYCILNSHQCYLVRGPAKYIRGNVF